MKIYFKTYGCTANKADELTMRTLLKDEFDFVKNVKNSDMIIILTCGVKGSTQNKIMHRLKIFKEEFSDKKVLIAGCLPRIITKKLEDDFPNFSMIGAYQIDKISDIVKKILKNERIVEINFKKLKCVIPEIIKKEQPIVIASGCLNKCAYCATKLAKGNLFSFPINKIVKNVKICVENGAEKILLTATDTGSYGKDIGTNLVELLKEVVEIKGNFKIRVGMMNPNDAKRYLDELIEIYKNPKILKFLHVPIQSGSDRVLEDMNRNYSVKDFERVITKFRKEIPKIVISTDIICGFPTETKEDFEETLNLIKKFRPEVLNISKFYPRPNTEAKKMKLLKTDEVKRRSRKISKLHKEIKKDLIKPKY